MITMITIIIVFMETVELNQRQTILTNVKNHVNFFHPFRPVL